MIRILCASERTGIQTDYPLERLGAALKEHGNLIWVDFCGESNETCEPILRQVFGFHPLAVEDALQETNLPKVDDWGDYLYIVIDALDFSPKNGQLRQIELDVFLGTNYMVTHHDLPIPALDQTWESCQRDTRHLQNGADHLLYRLVDYVVAAYMPIVEQMDREIDEIEDRLFVSPSPSTVERLFELKRALLAMRRTIAPQREVLNKLARDDYRVIDRRDRIFFRDIYDALVRLHDLNESMRDLVSGALDTYLSVINNRMNEVMKTLTVITTLFMPISFVVGFFGMNFFGPVADFAIWTDKPAFWITLTILILLPSTMLVLMRHKMWV
ncbi:MAG: magnesium/cobalt transporter CorA [Anaerolineales bacterium]|nr:magnesium/cobalt transporter CorA [Anaerolineales bacterium]MCX7609779.1 magnesium/cobalt transporter CorA [Anaerolineales bacterium]MDW8226255.1 magnesium/cobalt transporter CorA [Anaerolineales bacterium]